jgi:Phosphotransferase enzyme family
VAYKTEAIMDAPNNTGQDAYRLLITRRTRSEILVVGSGSGWSLPRTEIPSRQRPAEQLTAAIHKSFELKTYCLFVPNLSSVRAESNANYVVMESVKQNDPAPSGSYWMPADVFDRYRDAEEAEAIREALGELNSYATGEKPGPFGKPGWLRELFQWTEEQIAPLGLRLTGNFRQLNASPTFSLMRLETHNVALWFKATGKPNEHELAVALSLARLFPKYVPRVLGIHSAWNGWLSAEAPGIELDEIAECSAWERAAKTLAELQIASIGKCSELLEGECRDLRLTRLSEWVDPFLARMEECMAAQEKPSPVPLVKSELASLQEGLAEGCELLHSFRFPDTLGHIDLNPGNILVSAESCAFLDWAEGCVSHPFLTFEYLRQHMERSSLEGPAVGARITAAYLRPWQAFFSPEELRRALAVAPLVAVFAYAVANDRWRSPETLRDAAAAGYLRSLTRRMYREAIQVAERSERCLESL